MADFMEPKDSIAGSLISQALQRAVAQLVERRSPKPMVGGSNPSCPANVMSRDFVLLL